MCLPLAPPPFLVNIFSSMMTTDIAVTDQEMIERQSQGFHDKLEELQNNTASNSRSMTREMQDN